MPPSPGKIHSLPIKVLYTIDSSPHSYSTTLGSRQDVYIHPPTPLNAVAGPSLHAQYPHQPQPRGPQATPPNHENLLGSCALKGIARGICYASPECIPQPTNLDYSIYNLDPTLQRTPRTFPPPLNVPFLPDQYAWTGKGFLSWVLNETTPGKTLIRGRITRDTEFGTHNHPDGGLEGLIHSGGGAGGGGEEWGLEVVVSLKGVDGGGKEGFRGRKEFGEMLKKGSEGINGSGDDEDTPRRIVVNQHGQRGALGPTSGLQSSGISPINPPSSSSVHNSPRNQSLLSTQTHNAYHRPSPTIAHLPPPRPSSSASTTSAMNRPVSSLPPSSIPMITSSSSTSQPPSRPSSTKPAQPPPPPPQLPKQSNATPRPTPLHRPSTPPPQPPRKSPPPTTPSRARLQQILSSELSPNQAKQLANNPTLLKLLRAVPNLNLGNVNIPRQSDTGSTSRSAMSETTSNGKAGNDRGKGKGKEKDEKGEGKESPAAETPTPSFGSNVLQVGNGSGSGSGVALVRTTGEGCYNCGTMVSECWRTKGGKDGTKKKVCNACGIYFNTHKKMRPSELWGLPADPDHTTSNSTTTSKPPTSAQPPLKHKLTPEHQPRQSPRLHHHSGHGHEPPPGFESPRKRQRVSSAGVRGVPPSPRMATRASAKAELGVGVFGSASKRDQGAKIGVGVGLGKALNYGSVPGPNFGVALGQSISLNQNQNQMNGNGNGGGGGLGSVNEMFSPSTLFGTSPIGVGEGGGGGGLGDGVDGEIDIESLLAQISSGNGEYDLDALFAGLPGGEGNGGGAGDGGLGDLMGGWEGVKEGGGTGAAGA